MYPSSVYKTKDKQEIIRFIQQYPFAALHVVGQDTDIVSTHIPLLLVPRGDDFVLQGHIIKESEHYEALLSNKKVTVVFNGPQGYISSQWYSEKNKASTWNYMTVHVKGPLSFLDDTAFLKMIQNFTLLHEGQNIESQAVLKNLPKAYTNKWLKYIVGIQIVPEKIEHTFKLSQDLDSVSFQSVLEELSKLGNTDLVNEMKKINP